jgi:hypothetical protein
LLVWIIVQNVVLEYWLMSDACQLMQIQSSLYLYACWIYIRSLRNKSAIFQDYAHECNADLIAVTETWLKEIDDAVRAEVKPTGYKLADVPRTNRRGGGTALFYRESINVSKHNAEVKTSLEFSEWKVILLNNYSPKAKSLPVNIHGDEVEVNIHRNHWAWGE